MSIVIIKTILLSQNVYCSESRFWLTGISTRGTIGEDDRRVKLGITVVLTNGILRASRRKSMLIYARSETSRSSSHTRKIAEKSLKPQFWDANPSILETEPSSTVLTTDPETSQILHRYYLYLGNHVTNNIAEYTVRSQTMKSKVLERQAEVYT